MTEKAAQHLGEGKDHLPVRQLQQQPLVHVLSEQQGAFLGRAEVENLAAEGTEVFSPAVGVGAVGAGYAYPGGSLRLGIVVTLKSAGASGLSRPVNRRRGSDHSQECTVGCGREARAGVTDTQTFLFRREGWSSLCLCVISQLANRIARNDRHRLLSPGQGVAPPREAGHVSPRPWPVKFFASFRFPPPQQERRDGYRPASPRTSGRS